MSELKKQFRYKKALRQKAFTMVEIIVALALLSTSLLAVFGVLRANLSASRQSNMLTRSTLLAETLLAQLMLEDNISFETTEGNKDAFNWEIQIAPTELDNLATIHILIDWKQQQRSQQYQLFSLKHIEPIYQGN